VIYTDGSFENGTCGWAFAVFCGEQKVHEESGNLPDIYGARNVTAELHAVLEADQWLQANYPSAVATIVSDYTGIRAWALGAWRANSQAARDYVAAISPRIEYLRFQWVRGHAGTPGNIRADELAVSALFCRSKTPARRRSSQKENPRALLIPRQRRWPKLEQLQLL
jgi:ribonuclease HI